jgi:outer membrane receptor protein involved in Fe transport
MDGQPLNDPLASYSKVKWNLVSLASVERIEIYKGSGAVAFGDGTSGGAIRITSKEVRGNQAKIKMEGGSLNTWQQSLNAGSQYGPFSVGVSADTFPYRPLPAPTDRESGNTSPQGRPSCQGEGHFPQPCARLW